MGTYGVQMKGVLSWFVCWARRAGARDFYPALAALVSPVQNICFLIAHFFPLFVPIAHQPGQSYWVSCFLVQYMSMMGTNERAEAKDTAKPNRTSGEVPESYII